MALLRVKEELLKLLSLTNQSEQESAIYQLLGLHSTPLIDPNDPHHLDSEAYADGSTGPEALYTSFHDFFTLFKDFQKRGLSGFCDVGGGIGKGKFIFDLLSSNPKVEAFSLELLEQRHHEGLQAHKKLGLPFNEGFQCCDLRTTLLPKVDAYFIYLPVGEVLDKVLSQLEEIFQEKEGILYVIESHGDLIPYLQNSIPLKLIAQSSLTSKRHNPDLHVYQIGPLKSWRSSSDKLRAQNLEAIKLSSGISFDNYGSTDRLFTLKQLRHREDLQLLIKDDERVWLGDLLNWKYGIVENTIEIQTPYRIVELSQIQAIVQPNDQWQELITKRSQVTKPPLSIIRKVFVEPKSAIEYSNGEIEDMDLTWPCYSFHCPKARLFL